MRHQTPCIVNTIHIVYRHDVLSVYEFNEIRKQYLKKKVETRIAILFKNLSVFVQLFFCYSRSKLVFYRVQLWRKVVMAWRWSRVRKILQTANYNIKYSYLRRHTRSQCRIYRGYKWWNTPQGWVCFKSVSGDVLNFLILKNDKLIMLFNI